MTTSGSTRFQKMKCVGQPYTEVRAEKKYEEVEIEIDGKPAKGLRLEEGYAVVGHTLEERLSDTEDSEPEVYWEEYDLGHVPTLEEAHQMALDWRESLRGQYLIR